MAAGPIIILLPYLSCSGLELFGLRFAADLQARGHPVLVAAPDASLIAEQCFERGLPRLEFPEIKKYEPWSIPACVKMMRETMPAAIIAFRTQLMYPIHLARLITGMHVKYFLFYRLGAGRFFRKDPFHRRLFNYLSAVVPNAEHVENRIYKYWGVEPEKVVCIKSGVDTKKYQPDNKKRQAFRARLGLGENDFLIGSSGRIHPEKGSEILLRTLFDENGPARRRSDVKLVYVGREYQDGYNEHLHKVAKELKVGERFKILPFTNDVTEVYPGFDLFAFAVTSSETYAYVALEAMACGVPPMVPLVGGMKEMYTDGQQGWFFEHRNTDSLRQTLKEILAMPRKDIIATGRQARQRIVARASWSKMMDKYLQLFKNCKVEGYY
jgi:glycosyltransferase involved in cell wall biosynthesis